MIKESDKIRQANRLECLKLSLEYINYTEKHGRTIYSRNEILNIAEQFYDFITKDDN